MTACYRLTFMCYELCLANYQYFKSCVSWIPFCIFCCVSQSQERILGWPGYPLDLIKNLITVCWVWWRHH